MSSEKQQVWGSHLKQTPTEQNVLFCAGRDVKALPMADEVLLPYDIWTNRAHTIMLKEQGLISAETLSAILKGLNQLESLVQEGKFDLNPEKEDVHINVESYITENFGVSVGGTMHTGRSRNDQIACDMRLYQRDACLTLGENLVSLATALLEQAKAHAQSAMPGFTHYQPGMITTWGHWMCSYVQGLCRDLERTLFAFDLLNRNPLGAAAAYGTSWKINRQRTTELLGYDRVETNTTDCISSRWENEAQLAQTYAFVMNHLSVIAQDLIFLSSPYVGMLTIDDSMVTGSSIMPQKKNPDFAEVIKGKASLAHGTVTSLFGVQKGGLSGYNRDMQVTKYLIMDIVRECEAAPVIVRGVFETLKVNQEMMKQRCEEGFMNAVDVADYLARTRNLSFRECYNVMALTVKYSQEAGQITQEALQKALGESGLSSDVSEESIKDLNDPQFILNQRQHEGAPAPDQLAKQIEELSQQIQGQATQLEQHREKLRKAHQACVDYQV